MMMRPFCAISICSHDALRSLRLRVVGRMKTWLVLMEVVWKR